MPARPCQLENNNPISNGRAKTKRRKNVRRTLKKSSDKCIEQAGWLLQKFRHNHPLQRPLARFVALKAHHAAELKRDDFLLLIFSQQQCGESAQKRQMPNE